MFQFTTQTVFNSIVKATVNRGKRTPKDANLIIAENDLVPTVRIGNTRFSKGDILDIYVAKPRKEALASVSFDLSKVFTTATAEQAGSYRIALYIGLSMNSQDAFYSTADVIYKGKPLYIEFPVNEGDTAENVVKKIVPITKKYLLFMMGTEQILDVTTDGTTVTFTGVNGYQQIKRAALQFFDVDAIKVDCCTNTGDYINKIEGVPVMYSVTDGEVTPTNKVLLEDGSSRELADYETAITPGLEAFGDYSWIVHNLRLPTMANTYFWAHTKNEFPTVGATYTQYIITMCKDRDRIAGEVVGQRATSVTTHVLYVNSQANTATLETELKKLLTKPEDWKEKADTVLDKPYGE